MEEILVPNTPFLHQDAVNLTLEPKSFPDPVDICSDVVQRRKVLGLGHTHVKMGKLTIHAPKARTRSSPSLEILLSRERMCMALWRLILSKSDKSVPYIS